MNLLRRKRLIWTLPVLGMLGILPAALVSQSSQTAHPSQPNPSQLNPSQPNPSQMERTFQAATAAQDRGDLDQAQALLSQLHADHPGVFAVDESLGLLLVGRGDILNALPLLEAGAREKPSSDAAHVNFGAALYQLHRQQPALAEFERAVRINPANVAAQQSLGRICEEMHRTAEGARALLAAQRRLPDDPDLKLDCVTALLAANRVSEAKAMLATVADAGESARAQSLLGEAAERNGRSQEAGEHLARAAQLDPSEENAWQLARELLRHWAFDAAVVELEAAAAKYPESRRLHLALAAALFGDSKYTEAIPAFADLLAGEPGNAAYADLLGIACNAPGQSGNPRCAALVIFAQAHPRDAQVATSAATFLWTESANGSDSGPNPALARKLLASALAINPNLAEAQLEMGVVKQDDADFNGSIPYLERALQLKPGLSEAHFRLGRAYWRAGRKQEARKEMELQKKSAAQEQEDLHRRLAQITSLAANVSP